VRGESLTRCAVLRQLGVSHVKGILLHGPPGTGKTLVARKLGQLLAGGREPRVVNGPELLSRWVGASEENVRALFSDAEADWKRNGDDASLHVIIFDEIDALCRARGGGGGGGGGGAQAVGDSVVNQLLTKMDGVASAPNLLLIGLTNRRDLLDEALLRPGRLEVQLEIGLPDRAGRAAILGIHTRAMAASGLLAADVDLDALAAETPNYSGAELAGVVRAAASFAVERIMRPHTHLGDVRTHGAAEGARGLGLGTVSVRASDFSAALTEVAPLLGRAPGSGTARGGLSRTHAPGGVLPTGARLAGVQASLATLARAAADGEPVHALLMGPPGAGKSALAAAAADSLGFPFARCVSASPEAAAGGAGSGGDAGGCPLAAQLLRSFRDAAASSSSVLLLDDVERLIGYSPVGPAYSNAALQTLLALLRAPRGGRVSKGHTLVLATSSDAAAMGALGIAAAFGATVRVPALDAAEAAAALAAAGALGKEDAAAAALQLEAGRDGAGLPVKHLLALVALARRRVGKPAGLLTRAELLETAAQFSIDPRERT